MSKLIIIVVGVLMFLLGNNFENPIILFFEAVFIATGILFVLSTIAGYGKSQKEKDKIEREIFEQFHEGMTRRTRYDLNKRIMNDQINKDIKDNIAKGINQIIEKEVDFAEIFIKLLRIL